MENYERRYVLEIMVAQMERTIRRLWILCFVLIALCVATNFAWWRYESQFETVSEITTTQEVNQEGDSNIVVGGDYGKTDSKNNDNH